MSSAAKYLPVRPPATPDLPALPAAPELVNNLGGLLPLDCAIAKNGRDGNARALALAQFHDPPPLQVESASGRSPGARQDQSWESTELYLSALLARYVSLAAPELGSLDKLINLHLATTRPPRDIGRVQEQCQSHLRVGVTGSGRAWGDRHLRRQAATLSKLQAQITSGRASTYQPALSGFCDTLGRARGLQLSPVRVQAASHRVYKHYLRRGPTLAECNGSDYGRVLEDGTAGLLVARQCGRRLR